MSDHADRRPADDDLDDAERELASRLSSALIGQATTVVLAAEAFDPTRSALLDRADDPGAERPVAVVAPRTSTSRPDQPGIDVEPPPLAPLPITPDGRAGRGRIVWIAGAAAAALLVAAIVMINSVRQPTVDAGNDDAPLVGPDTAWTPTWVPDGLELWTLETEFGDPAAIVAGAETGQELPMPLVQLLGSTTTGAKILVSIAAPSQATSMNGTPIAIRGASGTSSSEQAMGSGSPTGISIEWQEAGSAFGAFVTGVDEATAVALLDGLAFADDADPAKGFAAPPDGSWTVHTDDPTTRSATGVVGAMFGYDRGRPTGGRLPLRVVTLAGGARRAGYPGYLPTAFLGSMGDDGVARAFVPASGDRPAESYTVWPDGRTVYSSGVDLDEAGANRIADSLEPMTRHDLEARSDEVNARLGAGDVLASADLPSGRVEVIGEPQASAICLTTGGRRVCRTSESLGGSNPALMGTVIIDGTWYVFAAGEGPVELGVGSTSSTMTVSGTAVAVPVGPNDVPGHDPSVEGPTTVPAVESSVSESVEPAIATGPGPSTSLPVTGSESHVGITPGTGPVDRSVPFESAVSGSWTLALLVVPADVDGAWATFPGQSMSFPRPSR